MLDNLKGKLENISGGKVLDVATGGGSFVGRLTECLADYSEIIAIDVIDKYLQEAQNAFEKEKISNVTFVNMNGENLEFDDDSFDTVSISNSLHHLTNIEKTLNEMKRVLKPSGLFIISEMYRDNQNELQQMNVDFHDWWSEVDRRTGVSHNKTFKRQELIDISKAMELKNYEFVDQIWEIEKPKEEEMLNSIVARCDEYIERIKDHPDGSMLKEKGEKLKERLFEIGWGSAKQLIIIARK